MNVDLSLVTIDDIIDELKKRSQHVVIGTITESPHAFPVEETQVLECYRFSGSRLVLMGLLQRLTFLMNKEIAENQEPFES